MDTILEHWKSAVLASLEDLRPMLAYPTVEVQELGQPREDLSGAYIDIETDHLRFTLGLLAQIETMRTLVGRMLGLADSTEGIVEEDVYDGLCELSNIVAGSVKASLSSVHDKLVIGLPHFLTGRLHGQSTSDTVWIPIAVDGLVVHVHIHRETLSQERLRSNHLERLLAEREARLEAVLQTAPDGIVTLRDDVVESINPAAAQLFGVRSARVQGRPLSMLLPTWEEQVGETLALETGSVEMEGLRSDGQRIPVEVTTSRFTFRDAHMATVIIRDLTERRQLESELRQAQKLEAVGQLAAGIAHEINTPTQFVGDSIFFIRTAWSELSELVDAYRGLLGRASSLPPARLQLLGEEAWEEADADFLFEEVPGAFDRTLSGVSRIATIVRAMKQFAHSVPGEMRPSDLNQALESTLTISRSEYKHSAEVQTDFGELPPVICRISDLNQVFLNILVNAAHAIEARRELGDPLGHIRISTRLLGDQVEIRIADDGVGMPESVRTRIFEPFFTTKEVGRGSGQGLAISYSIVVDKHAGSIGVQSEQGVGTEFTILLPVGGPPDQAAAPSSNQREP